MNPILIIEDDKDIAELIQYNLKSENIGSQLAPQGIEGLQWAKRNSPPLIVLDLMLPDMSGLEVCRILKGDPKTGAIPILMLTAKGEEVDRIVGFEVGADDYLTKPFSPRELVLRIRAILKRSHPSSRSAAEKPSEFGLLKIDPEKFRVWVKQNEVYLTSLEFKLLSYLLKIQGRVAPRETLLDQVWGFEAALTTRSVDTSIKRLREKLGQAGDYIETIRGVGYRFKENLEGR